MNVLAQTDRRVQDIAQQVVDRTRCSGDILSRRSTVLAILLAGLLWAIDVWPIGAPITSVFCGSVVILMSYAPREYFRLFAPTVMRYIVLGWLIIVALSNVATGPNLWVSSIKVTYSVIWFAYLWFAHCEPPRPRPPRRKAVSVALSPT
jgi:hypothetical protein